MFRRYDRFAFDFVAQLWFVITIIRRLLLSCTGHFLYAHCKPSLSHVSMRCVQPSSSCKVAKVLARGSTTYDDEVAFWQRLNIKRE